VRLLQYALTLFAIICFPLSAFTKTERVEVVGEETYTYGDNESLVSARQVARSMAIRRAIESYQIFVDAASTVKDFQLKNDIIQTISSGYLHDLQVVEETAQGRTIHVKIRAYIAPNEIKAVLARALSGESRTNKGDRSRDLDCKDFPSQAAAQAELRAHPSDPYKLDLNRDGIACERNPSPYDTVPVQRSRRSR
jgi:hypothetical protein